MCKKWANTVNDFDNSQNLSSVLFHYFGIWYETQKCIKFDLFIDFSGRKDKRTKLHLMKN